MESSFLDAHSAKAIEYFLSLFFLLCFVPLWNYLTTVPVPVVKRIKVVRPYRDYTKIFNPSYVTN